MKERRIIAFVIVGIVMMGLIPNSVFAQDFTPSYHIGAEYNYLYSTHSTKFRGPTLLADKDLNKHWAIGVGIGYNTCPFHPDNGYDLKDLKLIPVFASLQYTISRNKIFDPYGIVKTGLTFMRYDQKIENRTAQYQTINERGWYTYIGGGTYVNICSQWQLYVNLGLIGYKMSFNDLDVNPHGVAGNIGIRVKI